ncbi:MAG: hypothetical protein ACR2PT_23755 [Endozoicomonas sp.]
MSASKLKKMVTLDTPPGSAAERLAQRMQQSELEGHGRPMQYMRQWLQTGFLVSELGHGILESWLAMERDGHTRGMSQKQKAQRLIELLQRTNWESSLPAETAPPVAPGVVSVPVSVSVPDLGAKSKLKRHLA